VFQHLARKLARERVVCHRIASKATRVRRADIQQRSRALGLHGRLLVRIVEPAVDQVDRALA
jgi:hypothetical protein